MTLEQAKAILAAKDTSTKAKIDLYLTALQVVAASAFKEPVS